jgi:nicotinate dehydrogenase subunit B
MSGISQLARRDLFKAGGALFVGFSLAGTARAQDARAIAGAANAPDQTPPDPKLIDSWLVVGADNQVRVFLGKVELGQGNGTTLLQIVAEELDVGLVQISAAPVDTLRSMNQGATVSSTSTQVAGPQLRAAAAELRQELLRRAAERLKLPLEQLRTEGGAVQGGGQSVTYGALIGAQTVSIPFTGHAPQKSPAAYGLVGKPVARRDIPGKIAGTHDYVQHASATGMLHGRVVRPRGQGAYGPGARLVSLDSDSIAHLPDVRIVRRGDFVGVVAPRQWDAVRAAEALRVTWEMGPSLPGDGDLHAALRGAKTTDSVVFTSGDIAPGFAAAAHTASATFQAPYQAHAPFGPSCALATPAESGFLVTCSSQDVFALRDRIAAVLGLPATKVRVRYTEGSGCYGHSCYDDAAIAAAIMAQSVGQPVRVQFMRWDELGWDNYGPAHVGEIRIAADATGRIVAYAYDGWHHGWMIEETSEQLASGAPVHELAKGPGSLIVNAVDVGGMYDIPNRKLVNHAVDGLSGFLKGANLRSPMDLSYSFASEQTIDELARQAGLDPVAFRRRNITDPRWRDVLEALVTASDWQPRPTPQAGDGAILAGRGIALGTHRASRGGAVAEVEVDRTTGQVVARRIFAALDCGLAVNPAVVESQIVGMSIQGTSRMLKEQVRFSRSNVTSLDWESYPVLRFAEHPAVIPIVIPSTEPSSGAGEEALAAVGAAIANAVFDATGARLTEYPLTPDRVLAALKRLPQHTG